VRGPSSRGDVFVGFPFPGEPFWGEEPSPVGWDGHIAYDVGELHLVALADLQRRTSSGNVSCAFGRTFTRVRGEAHRTRRRLLGGASEEGGVDGAEVGEEVVEAEQVFFGGRIGGQAGQFGLDGGEAVAELLD
jgi:hypothetical protein